MNEEVERRHAEYSALALFGIAALVMAIVCGAIIVSGWFAGVIQDSYERVFWLGAILAGLGVAVLGAAAVPGGSDSGRAVRRIRNLTRAGLVMFLVAPALCIGSLVADFFY
jgi:hypothetical protein